MLARARRRLGPRVGLALGDLSAMPFAQAQFDAVIALNVLYFCDPAGSMLCEMRRVLRPGGRLVAYVTDRETMERWSFVRKGMHRLFDETSLVAAFAAAGFEPNSTSVTVARIAHGVTGLFAVGRR